MNMLKKFMRKDPVDDLDEMDSDLYTGAFTYPEEVVEEPAAPDANEPAPVPAPADKTSLKLMRPTSHTEATKIADRMKEGCIVVLEIGQLPKDQARRLVDFLAGVAYVLDGEMLKTGKSTIIMAPAGVDISNIAPDEPQEEEIVEVNEPAEEQSVEEA